MASARSPWRSRMFGASSALSVTLTNPTSGQVITTAAPDITWTFSPGTQASYRVRVFSDAAGTTQIYSSGYQVSATQSHQIPAGVLSNATEYWVRVDITTTDGDAGDSDLVDFETSFAPSVDVTGVRVAVVGGCEYDPSQLPGLRVRWDEVVPGGGETFIQYLIYRRTDPTDAWIQINSVAAIGTVEVIDYAANSGTFYQYAVVWQALAGFDILESNKQNPPPGAMVLFNWSYIHAVTGVPDQSYVQNYVLLPTWSVQAEWVNEVSYARPWGRQAPTAYLHGGEAYRFTIETPPIALSRPQWWTSMIELFQLQRTAGTIYCLRLGEARMRAFVAVEGPSRRIDLGSAAHSLSLQQVHYDEDQSA